MSYLRFLSGATSAAWFSIHSRMALLMRLVSEGLNGCALAYSRILPSRSASRRRPICCVAGFFSAMRTEHIDIDCIWHRIKERCLTVVDVTLRW